MLCLGFFKLSSWGRGWREDKEIELKQKDQILITKVRDRHIGIHCTILSSFVLFFFFNIFHYVTFRTVIVHPAFAASLWCRLHPSALNRHLPLSFPGLPPFHVYSYVFAFVSQPKCLSPSFWMTSLLIYYLTQPSLSEKSTMPFPHCSLPPPIILHWFSIRFQGGAGTIVLFISFLLLSECFIHF